jgi:segregation and condensation protein B
MTLPEEDDQDALPFDADDAETPSLGAHGDSIEQIDDELAGRESWLKDEGLDEAEARAAFAEEIRDQIVDADPSALDAAAGIATNESAAPASMETLSHAANETPTVDVARRHLRGLLEALLFVSDRPLKTADLADVARAQPKECRALLEELSNEYRDQSRGFQLDELAGGWQLRTAATFAPFVREMSALKPVKLTRAQVETLAIIAYRQPVTRPEIEDVRGVDGGAVLKLLLDRDLVRILGKKDEPGRPLLYGTTSHFLEFFGLKSLRDLPTLREFTELTDESKEVVERELGEVLPEGPKEPVNTVGNESVAAVDVDPEAEPTTEAKPEAEAATDASNEGLDDDDAQKDERPGGASYDPSDEELFPDDDDSDFDDEDEDEGDEDDDEEDEDDAGE